MRALRRADSRPERVGAHVRTGGATPFAPLAAAPFAAPCGAARGFRKIASRRQRILDWHLDLPEHATRAADYLHAPAFTTA